MGTPRYTPFVRRGIALLLPILFSVLVCAGEDVADLPKRALEKAQLTSPGSQPFHLKAEVEEATNPDNDKYKATIEEYWVSPGKWRRTVKTQDFTETLVVNGPETHEEITGDYYPNWLRSIVTAIFDPVVKLEGVDLTRSSDNPVVSRTQSCRRFEFRAGLAPVSNRVFSSYCFEGGRIASMSSPGFHAEYKDYKAFGGKDVARRVREYIEPGEEVEANIIELTELANADDALFVIAQPNQPLRTVNVSEETLRKLAPGPIEINWPPVRGGKTEGVLSVFVSLDRQGRVRETSGLNSDHPEMTDAARAQLAAIRFKPAVSGGVPTQVEGILTFAYQTKIDDPYPELSDAEARKLAINLGEPKFPRGLAQGTVLTLKIFVAEDGKVHGSGPVMGEDGPKTFLFREIHDWRFKPLERNGKVTPFHATLRFVVP
jgi:hypothetical protein